MATLPSSSGKQSSGTKETCTMDEDYLYVTSILTCGACTIVLPVAIAALVIANEDNTNSACDNGNFTVGLTTFLNVAGMLQLVVLSLTICIFCTMSIRWETCCALDCFQGCIERGRREMSAVAFCILLFDLIWAVIGLVIYCNEMDSDCQQEAIAIMILSWCIIQMCYVCCFCITAAVCPLGVAAVSYVVSRLLFDTEDDDYSDCVIM